MALAHLVAHRFEEADRWTQRALDQRPQFPGTLLFRAAALANMGRLVEAAATVKDLLAIQPKASIGRMAKDEFRNPSDRTKIIEGLRIAGLPD